MAQYELTLHPDKTKIVFCKDYRRNNTHPEKSFTFLGFSYEPRMIKSIRDTGRFFLCFRPAISNAALKHIREKVREIVNPRWTTTTIEYYAEELNNRIRGWINYYCKIERWKIGDAFGYINYLLMKWLKNVYRLKGVKEAWQKLKLIQQVSPDMFEHWKFGIKT